ncbi:MAG: S8 family serine peptidase [Fermentimonas sp.]|nr:S8 family serine peptidase [Fermentimonas sp.]
MSPTIEAEMAKAKSHNHSLIVQYKNTNLLRKQLTSIPNVGVIKSEQIAPGIELLQLNEDTNKIAMLATLKKDDNVLFVEENRVLKLHSLPNDPGYVNQWALKNIKAVEAWDKMSGAKQKIVVAVIDSGIEMNHSDLINRIDSRGYNFISNNSKTYDINGHGTAVSGIIAAQTNNLTGMAGVVGTLNVKIMPLQTADSAGDSYVSNVIRAIDYAIEQHVDVINLSMGSTKISDIENAAIQRAIQKGIVVVASAGNDGNSVYEYPASYENVISVGSISSDNNRSNFSNYNNKVDVVAPGEQIYSCALQSSYRYLNGTSFSAPIVSGVAASLRAMDPSLSPQQIESIITDTAVDKGSSGRDNYYGFGLLDFSAAVNRIAKVSVLVLSLDQAKIDLTIGDSTRLTANILPTNASNQNISWASDNPDVANVDSQGLVTAIAPGEATIIAISEDGGKTASCIIKVLAPIVHVSEIKMDREVLILTTGSTVQLTATVLPTDASKQTLSWASDNSMVATVNNNGLVTALGSGVATIIAVSEDGGKTAIVRVTVNDAQIPSFAGKEWKNQLEVPINKEWTIKFNSELDITTITNSNIYVSQDIIGNDKIPGTSVEISSINCCCILLSPPKGGWKVGESYYLFITKDVKSAFGKPLDSPIRMKFVIVKG